LLVAVAPRVTLARPTPVEPAVFTGTIRPKLPGATVAVERRRGTVWALVDETFVDQSGAFRLELDALPAGAYRARTISSEGYAAGVSAVVMVPG
jgi:hypothetical protein